MQKTNQSKIQGGMKEIGKKKEKAVFGCIFSFAVIISHKLCSACSGNSTATVTRNQYFCKTQRESLRP